MYLLKFNEPFNSHDAHMMYITCSYRLVKEGESSVDPVQLSAEHEAAIMSGVNVVPPPRQKKRTSSFGKSSSSSRLLRSASKEQAIATASSYNEQPEISQGIEGVHIINNGIHCTVATSSYGPSPLHKAIQACIVNAPGD